MTGPGFPQDTSFASRSHAVATIHYPKVCIETDEGKQESEAKKGTLIYCKSTLVEGLDLITRGYRATHEEFPHESTGDQFFSEAQLEAYRALGFRIGEAAAGDFRCAATE